VTKLSEKEGLFKTRINSYMLIECDRCPMEFHDLDKFEEHWLKEHSIAYGPRSYKKIIVGQIPQKEVIKIVEEAKQDLDIGRLLDCVGQVNGLLALLRLKGALDDPQVIDALDMMVKEAIKSRKKFKKWFGAAKQHK